MEIEAIIIKMKDIYPHFMNFIEATDDSNDKLDTLIEILDEKEILHSQDEVQILFQLISKLADNYHRTSDILDKFVQIFEYLVKDVPSPISYFIPDYTKYNKRILFLLLEKGFVKPDDNFLNQYLQRQESISQTNYYLYPRLKEYLEEEIQEEMEEEILPKYSETISSFEEKCQIGENDLYICSLIRSDSVEEFIKYVNRTNLSLSTTIKPSIFETNSFLIDKKPTLIEYAAFFGSIQIIRYLKYNQVPLTSSLWRYTIHSNNAELIHFLEENEVEPEEKKEEENNDFSLIRFYRKIDENPFNSVIFESIKCHHNSITNYIKDNFYSQTRVSDFDQNEFFTNYSYTVTGSLNFFFYPNEIKSVICNKYNEFKICQLCFSLTQITIPSSVTLIRDYGFWKCSALTQITIPSSVTSIGNDAFSDCSSLKQITIPSSVTSIRDCVFLRCSSLTQITIPSSVTSIGHFAFSYCKSLTQITIPSSVTEIGHSAFSYCKSLIQIAIPSSVTKIGCAAFQGCSSLTQITIPSFVTEIDYSTFEGCSSLTQITIPPSITSIGSSAFKECYSLLQITLPFVSIKNNAFDSCPNFAMDCDSTINWIYNKSFRHISVYCSNIKNIDEKIKKDDQHATLWPDLQSIGNYFFNGFSSLIEISIPSSVTSIGNDSFSGCSSLTKITFSSSSLISIGNDAFRGCSSLIEITIPSSVTEIGEKAFMNCSSLKKIILPHLLKKIKSYMLYNCRLVENISIPPSVDEIGEFAFSECSSIVEIIIPEKVISIEPNAFEKCTSLKKVILPESLEEIGAEAFLGCKSLENIIIPNSVTFIDDTSFIHCPASKCIDYSLYDS